VETNKPTIQLDVEQAITFRKAKTTAHLALQDNQLVPERGILCLKSATRLERRSQQRQERKRSSATIGADVHYVTRSIRMTFSAHTGGHFCATMRMP
jgi:hypothetical protein